MTDYEHDVYANRDKLEKEIAGRITSDIDAVLKPFSDHVNQTRMPEQIELDIDKKYGDPINDIIDKLEKYYNANPQGLIASGIYPDQVRDYLEKVVGRLIVDRPYIDQTSEYPFHIWFSPTTVPNSLANVKEIIAKLDSNLSIETSIDNGDKLILTNSGYPNHWLTVYPDLTSWLDDDEDCDSANDGISLDTLADAQAIVYFAGIAEQVFGIKREHPELVDRGFDDDDDDWNEGDDY